MQKIKIGHRANFRAKNKCFPQILFPVRAILRSINFRCADFNTDSADACILILACVDCARSIPREPSLAIDIYLNCRISLFSIIQLHIKNGASSSGAYINININATGYVNLGDP